MKIVLFILLLAGAAHAQTVRSPAQWQAAAIEKHPDLGKPDSDFNRRFLAAHVEKSRAEPAFFSSADWPVRLADQVAKALADGKPREARLAVENLIVKRVQVDGMLFGKSTVFRYFFAVMNEGGAPFVGRVDVTLQNKGAGKGVTATITDGVLEPGGRRVGFVESRTGPEKYHGAISIIPSRCGAFAIPRFRGS